MWYSATDVMTIKANLISVLLQFARTAFITFHEDVHNKTLSISDPALARGPSSHMEFVCLLTKKMLHINSEKSN